MTVSDDEVEIVVRSVTNYHFVDDKDEPISFAMLPIVWSASKSPDSEERHVYMHGTIESGLEKIYRQVVAWKLHLSFDKPEISVLCKENGWIKLLKPRKSFEDTIRTILIAVHYLHFVKKHPDTSATSVWGHLQKTFSLYKVTPSENDLLDHLHLMRAAVKHVKPLSKCKCLLSFLESTRKRKASDKDIPDGLHSKKTKFVTTDESDESIDAREEDLSDEEEAINDNEEKSDKCIDARNGGESDKEDMADSVCSFCDNGGALLCCEGKCLRAFHATVDEGVEAGCVSLGLSKAEVEAIKKFVCLNCRYKQHQCFACGKLGSSNESSGTEVFPCASETCGYFYHARCVAKLLHPGNEAKTDYTRNRIIAGGSFTCPVHKCRTCKEVENKEVYELQFAVCRRCPKVYHRKCLPRDIPYTSSADTGIVQRAWEDLLTGNRVLIYCSKHQIDPFIMTPERNHIKFPSSDFRPRQVKRVAKKRGVVSEVHPPRVPEKTLKEVEKVSAVVKDDFSTKKVIDASLVPDRLKYVSREVDVSFSLNGTAEALKEGEVEPEESNKNAGKYMGKPRAVACKKRETAMGDTPIKKKSSSSPCFVHAKKKEKTQAVTCKKREPVVGDTPIKKKSSSSPCFVDTNEEERLADFMKEQQIPTISVVKVNRRQKTLSSCSSSKVDKTTPQRKVECSVQTDQAALQKVEDCNVEVAEADQAALQMVEDCKIEVAEADQAALQMLEDCNVEVAEADQAALQLVEDCSVEVEEADYESEILSQKTKLKIVDKLHWYLQNGDTMASFCCDADDYSDLMRQKLEAIGKRCPVKHCRVFEPKSDDNSEKRDWISAYRNDLPTGSHLIIGLKLPLGVNVALADEFIDEALKLKPKLLILTVPKEIKRLLEKETSYELIWEDCAQLPEKRSSMPLLLYLWSRSDWTSKHKAIALKQRHISQGQNKKQKVTFIDEHKVEDEGTGEDVILIKAIKVPFAKVSDETCSGQTNSDVERQKGTTRTVKWQSVYVPGPINPYSSSYRSHGWLEEE